MTSAQTSNEVCLIDANITSILQLNLTASLVSLNLHCNSLKHIEGLDVLRNLKYLDLSSNNIEKIQGIERLLALKYLNLSCNAITVVEGLETLKQLVKLDLSYNSIKDITGLKTLGCSSPTARLQALYLHGNQIFSIDHIIDCLQNLSQLKHVVFMQNNDINPVCHHSKYRSLLLSMLTNITILDNHDRSGKLKNENTDDDIHQQNDIDDYINYLLSSDSADSAQAQHGGSSQSLTTPRIDDVLSKFRSQATNKTQVGSEEIIPRSNKIALSADHEVRLEKLEHQLAQILYKPAQPVQEKNKSKTTSCGENTSEKQNGPETSPDTDSPKSSPPTKYASPKFRRRPIDAKPKPKTTLKTKPGPQTVKKRSKKVVNTQEMTTSGDEDLVREEVKQGKQGMMVEGKKYVRHPEDDATFLSLIQELDLERERRWKAEQAALKLVEHVKNLQIRVGECKKSEETTLVASTTLEESLRREQAEKCEVQKSLADLQSKYEEVCEHLKCSRESEEELRKGFQNMQAATKKLETERMQQHAHETLQSQQHQMKASGLARELDLLKNTNKQQKDQVRQLQELLATREHQHKVEMEGLIRPDSRDVRELIDREVIKQESRYELLFKQWSEKLSKKSQEYHELENEFRMALQIEAKRFNELQEEFQKISEECSQHKLNIQATRQKETEATNMVTELTALVKEQKVRIAELTKSKQEVLSQNKDRLISLEEEVKVARKRISRIEVLEQDKSKLLAQIRAQESVIQGLRMERKLWSEELAQQGASLAQDRGRLESKVESLNAEVKQLQSQLQSANDSIKIKSKMLEDQTHSIRQLKQSLSTMDLEIKKNAQEKERIQEVEEQLQREIIANQELRDKNDGLGERKEELKEELSVIQAKFDKTEEANRSLKAKWQERSDLIGRLELEVKQMTKQFEMKEKKLVEEKQNAIKAQNSTMEKLHTCDNAFRNQLEKQKDVYEREIDRITREKDEMLKQSQQKIMDVENEMRDVLQEAATNKKNLEMRIKKLTSAFNEIQNDLAS